MVVLGAALPAPAFPQARTSGQIVGTVRDSTGPVVPKAELVLQDTGTGQVFNGRFSSFNGLPGGAIGRTTSTGTGP